MKVIINNEQDKIEYDLVMEKKIKSVLEQAAAVYELDTACEVGITLVDNEEIRQINAEYRQIDSATDVLSFALDEGEEFPVLPGEEHLLGDIIVSLERAQEQALEYGHSLERELAYLLIHGFLHLLGYDHMQEADKKVMREQEERVLAKLAIYR